MFSRPNYRGVGGMQSNHQESEEINTRSSRAISTSGPGEGEGGYEGGYRHQEEGEF